MRSKRLDDLPPVRIPAKPCPACGQPLPGGWTISSSTPTENDIKSLVPPSLGKYLRLQRKGERKGRKPRA